MRPPVALANVPIATVAGGRTRSQRSGARSRTRGSEEAGHRVRERARERERGKTGGRGGRTRSQRSGTRSRSREGGEAVVYVYANVNGNEGGAEARVLAKQIEAIPQIVRASLD